MDHPQTIVIIPHRNDHANLDRLMHRVILQKPDKVIVVDDASDEGPPQFYHPKVKVITLPERKGAAHARNVGASCAQSPDDILAFIDSDCDPMPLWLQCGRRVLQSCDMVGGVYHKTGFPKTTAEKYSRYIQNPVRQVSGNLFMRRSFFDKIGGWSTRPRHSEDHDIFTKACAHGIVVSKESLWAGHPLFTAQEKLRRVKRTAERLRQNGGDLRTLIRYAIASPKELARAFMVGGPRLVFWGVYHNLMHVWYYHQAKPSGGPTW